MRKPVISIIGLLFFLFTASCNSGKNENNISDTAMEENDEPSEKKYGIESGIIHMEVNAMGMKSPTIVYFEDYGTRECHDMTVTMKILGKDYTTHTRRIVKDGDIYEIDYTNNTYTKNQILPEQIAGFNLEQMKKQAASGLKLEKTGTENYLGKTCDKYTIESPSVQMKGTMLIYENIAMKANIEAMQIPTEMVVSKLEENVNIPDSLFEIPPQVKLK